MQLNFVSSVAKPELFNFGSGSTLFLILAPAPTPDPAKFNTFKNINKVVFLIQIQIEIFFSSNYKE